MVIQQRSDQETEMTLRFDIFGGTRSRLLSVVKTHENVIIKCSSDVHNQNAAVFLCLL